MFDDDSGCDCSLRSRLGVFALVQGLIATVGVGSLVTVVDQADGGEQRATVAVALALAISVVQLLLAVIQTLLAGRASRFVTLPLTAQLTELANSVVLGICLATLTAPCATSVAVAIVVSVFEVLLSATTLVIVWLVVSSDRFDMTSGEIQGI